MSSSPTTAASSICRFSETDAADILLADAAEHHFLEEGSWSSADQSKATHDARELAGDNQSPEILLPLRAKLVLARLTTVLPHPVDIKQFSWHTTLLTVILMSAAYVMGALTDRLCTDGSRINLLAVPLLLIIVWNLAVYAVLLLNALHLLPASRIPIRETAARLLTRIHLPRLKNHALKMKFASLWTRAVFPQIRLYVARSLHLAAAAFAVGILTSILVRGIGTAWIVGWESTWFADSPELVQNFINFTYGLIPAERFGLPPIPDAEGIATLRFDMSPSTDQAAPWLIRLMALLFASVILPRSLLALWDSVLLSRAKNRIDLSLDTPYYRSILSRSNIISCWTGLIIDSADPAEAERKDLQQLMQALSAADLTSNIDSLTHNTWEEAPDHFLARLPAALRYQLILLVDPINTPEDEVHGAFIENAAAWCKDHQSPSVAVILDCSSLRGRLGNTDARLALWETFVSQKHGVAIPAKLSNADSRRQLIESLTTLWH